MGKIVEGIEQNTPEWHEFRKGKIGASMAPAIMGVSPWVTTYQLYMRAVGLMPEQEPNENMVRGKNSEPIALEDFNEKAGFYCMPTVFVSDEYPWMIASLDGWCKNTKCGVEIKSGSSGEIVNGRIPDHYYPQIQHQLHVIGCNSMYYCSYLYGVCSFVLVERNDEYIKDLIEKEKDFMRRVDELDPPPLSYKDYVHRYDRAWQYAANAYVTAKREMQLAENYCEDCKKELIRLAEDNPCKGSGIKLQKVTTKGRINYANAIKDNGLDHIDWDGYRDKPSSSWRVLEE